jgi:HD-like signal output (HDOD) protein
MPTQVLVKQFARVAGIIQSVRNQPIDNTHVKQINATCEQFLSGFKQAPDVFSAQLSLYKSKYRYIDNLTFNSLVLCVLLCKQNKVNEQCCQQMLSSILSLYAERASLLSDCFQHGKAPGALVPNKKLVGVLHGANLDIWQQGYALAKLLFHPVDKIKRWPTTLSRLQKLIFCSHLLAIGVTHRQTSKPKPFAWCLKTLMQACPQDWVTDLQPLLEYPGLIPPGAMIKTQTQQSAIVLGVTNDRLLVNILSGEHNNDSAASGLLVKLFKSSPIRPLGAQIITGFSQVDQWWNEKWQQESSDCLSPNSNTFALDKPPSVLLEVQAHLTSEDVNIDKLAQQISAEPAFSDYLKRTATFSNRHKLPVQQVKHGLMMHGYLRTNNMLIEQALLLRLNQSYFPLQQDFIQFTRLAAQIAYNVAAKGDDVAPEQASTLACFACSGLFTQPGLKTRTSWPLSQQSHFDLRKLFAFKRADSLTRHALILCKAWQQPKLFTTAIEHHHIAPQQLPLKPLAKSLTCILGLSIAAAKRHYYAKLQICEVSQQYTHQALSALALSAPDFEHLCALSLTQTHCYSVNKKSG